MSVFLKKILWKTHKRFSRFVHRIGQIKSKNELAYLEKSADIAAQAFEDILKFIQEGRTELEISNKLRELIRLHGSGSEPFDFVVGAGPNGAEPHAVPSERKILLSEPVVMDFGATYKGFCSDLTRTFCVGEPSVKLKEIYEIVLEAQIKAIETVRPGKTCSEIDRTARDIIRAAGYGEAFVHSLGHGIGFEVHEMPMLKPKNEEVIKENMCFTIEPGIYLAGWGGVRIEDMVYVTEKGCRVLTKAPKDLVVRKW